MSGKQVINKYTEDQLKSLLAKYDQQKLTNSEIAEKFNVNKSTISRWRRKFKMQRDVPMPISDEELVSKYEKEHSNIADLAEELGVSKDSVRLHLKAGGVKNPRKSDPKKTSKNVLMYHYTEDQLKAKLTDYMQAGLTQAQIAKQLDSSPRTISRWIKKFGLNRLAGQQRVSDSSLCQDYANGHSANFIAKKYQVSPDFVIGRLKQHGVYKGKSHGMKTARHKMHDDLWEHIQRDLDRGARKKEIVNKYHISAPSLNSLLQRKQYLLGINREVYEELSDIDKLVNSKRYQSLSLRSYAHYLLSEIRRFVREFNFLPTRANLSLFADIDADNLSRWIKRCKLEKYFQPDTHRSYSVLRIMAYLKKNHIQFELNNRKIIAPLEIDIWVPAYNIGFEIDPVSMHYTTSIAKHRRNVMSGYHQTKSLKCFEKGVRLVHVYDWDDISEDQVLDYLQFSKFDFVNKTVDLNKLLITKDELHRLGYYSYHVTQPEKNYMKYYSHRKVQPGAQRGTSVVVYSAGKLLLKKVKQWSLFMFWWHAVYGESRMPGVEWGKSRKYKLDCSWYVNNY